MSKSTVHTAAMTAYVPGVDSWFTDSEYSFWWFWRYTLVTGMVTCYGLRDTGYRCGTCSTMPLAVSYVMEAFSLSRAESSSTWGKEETTEAGKE